MRKFSAVTFLVLFWFSLAYGQNDKQRDGDISGQLNYPVTSRELAGLVKINQIPSVSMIQALGLAEQFVSAEKIDVTNCYLFAVSWTLKNIDEPRWIIFWNALHGKNLTAQDVWIEVTMDSKVSRIQPPKDFWTASGR